VPELQKLTWLNKMNKKIAIYYEHPEWFQRLFHTLEKRGLPFDKIDASRDFYEPGDDFAVKYNLFFNRMSASAYLRNHANAIFYTLGLLANLETSGVRVINGYRAFQIEISKALQAALFVRLKIKSPKTRIVNSICKIAPAAADFAFPVIIKPNIGGRGAGIIKFDSFEELNEAVAQKLPEVENAFGIDSTVLVQEFAPKRGGFITRVEVLNGKLLYAIKIFPQENKFNLCPAEICQIENQSVAGEMCLVEAAKNNLKIEKTEVSPEIVETAERLMQTARIDVGGVEFLIDDRTGEHLFYDINALSNFIADAENTIGFDPHEKLVDFLQEEAEKCDTVTGCRFLAAG
jgi:glutathione synthase/RimK-type ligase-like ATP-grasp enzyme